MTTRTRRATAVLVAMVAWTIPAAAEGAAEEEGLAVDEAPHEAAAEAGAGAEDEGPSIAAFRLELGTTATGTTWRADAAAYGHLKLGFRFFDIFAPYVEGHEGYGLVDQRLLTLLALGVQVWAPQTGPVRFYGRLAFLHQHEESLSVVADDYASAIFGIGDGIRHRAGGEAGIGLDIPIWARGDVALYGAVDASAKLFPDDLGPMLYAGGGLNLGFQYAL